jgi:menaquinone-dependent protoporphyrinogen oxidase
MEKVGEQGIRDSTFCWLRVGLRPATMKANVLIAYATRYGATGEIAEAIGGVLHEAGIISVVQPVDRVKDLDQYEAIVLGSAVYMGHWRRKAVAFLETHEAALAAKPTWLFSSGPTGKGDPVELMKGWRFPEGLQPIADRIRPRDVAFFHGALDMNRLNFADKLIIKGIKAPIGDFRDWEMINAWAKSIAGGLRNPISDMCPVV